MADERDNSLKRLSEILLIFRDGVENAWSIHTFDRQSWLAKAIGQKRKSIAETVLQILSLFDSANDELLVTTIPEEIKREHSEYLQRAKIEFVAAIAKSSYPALDEKFDFVSHSKRLILLSDLAAAGKAPAIKELDREKIAVSTIRLISEVESSKLPEYARQALLIKLTAISCIVNQSAIYPDDQVRMRIKSVVADSIIAFEEFDDKYKSLLEKIVSWGGVALNAGAFGLGLIADGSEVIKLIEGPKS